MILATLAICVGAAALEGLMLFTVLLLNAGWNYLFFRARDVRASFVLAAGYSVVAVGLLIALVPLDRTAAWAFLPYVVYLVYANGWGYEVWRANSNHSA